MTDVLNSYLLQHKSLNIPGFGSIYIQNKAAITDFVNKQLFPASYSYRFDKQADEPDAAFLNYVAVKYGISDYEAMKMYNRFCTGVRTAMKEDGYYEWKGVGVFKKDSSGDVLFEEQNKLLPLLAPVPARRIIRKDARHAILVGDKEKTNVQMSELLNEEVLPVRKSNWWIYAVVLFAIAILVLVIHFFTTGFRWGAIGNQQGI